MQFRRPVLAPGAARSRARAVEVAPIALTVVARICHGAGPERVTAVRALNHVLL